VTWCVNCGRLFAKPFDKDLLKEEKKIIDLTLKQSSDGK
jgi:hypothetical protein